MKEKENKAPWKLPTTNISREEKAYSGESSDNAEIISAKLLYIYLYNCMKHENEIKENEIIEAPSSVCQLASYHHNIKSISATKPQI